MSIKQILRSMTRILPDRLMICLDYFRFFKKFPNLKNPKTFNEKLQWLKLYNRNPEYTRMVDKYEVKRYVAEHIGKEYTIQTYGVWNHFDEIDFDVLPNQFVLKCTHDSGGLVICRDKEKLDMVAVKKKLEKCLKHNYYYRSREWPYKNVKPRIIAEEYMEDENETSGLRDYKFFCFNNKPKFIYVSEGLENHQTARISFYTFSGERMPFSRSDYMPMPEKIELPNTMEKMKEIAAEIACNMDSPFVRIDLYSISGHIYFSEVTFFPCSGLIPFEPREWDKILGEWIRLS